MAKENSPKLVSLRDVTCLENLVVAYNTIFLMSSIFLVYIASTANELFSDINRFLSPSLLLPVIGFFIVLLAGVGYVGVAKQSSTLISMYTQLLIFIFALEIAAGLGVLSYRGDIQSMVSRKMKKQINDYPDDPFTANFVDYVQLELHCCGVNSYLDWYDKLEGRNFSQCQANSVILPESCCRKLANSSQIINERGCLSALHFLLHRSSILLALGVITISTIQIVGAYFSYSLAMSLRQFKLQALRATDAPRTHTERNKKSNYF